jgi:hypothetical protein
MIRTANLEIDHKKFRYSFVNIKEGLCLQNFAIILQLFNYRSRRVKRKIRIMKSYDEPSDNAPQQPKL